jgi:hypothetical protein
MKRQYTKIMQLLINVKTLKTKEKKTETEPKNTIQKYKNIRVWE